MEDNKAQVRRVSRLLFGQKLRLEVMSAVAKSSSDVVTLTAIAKEVGVTPSSVQAPLKSLIAVGLLEPGSLGADRERPLRRVDSPLWSIAPQLLKLAETSGRS